MKDVEMIVFVVVVECVGDVIVIFEEMCDCDFYVDVDVLVDVVVL